MMIKVLVHPADSFGFFFTWTPMAWVVSVMSVINSRTELRQDMENERERVCFASQSEEVDSAGADEMQQQNTFEHDLSGSPGLSQDIGSTAYTVSCRSRSLLRLTPSHLPDLRSPSVHRPCYVCKAILMANG